MNQSDIAWTCYRRLCDKPNVFTRWLLQQTSEILEQSGQTGLMARIQQILNEQSPLDKPRDHQGDSRSDVFLMNLSLTEALEIIQCIGAAERKGLVTRETEQRGLGGFAAAWREYVTFLSRFSNEV